MSRAAVRAASVASNDDERTGQHIPSGENNTVETASYVVSSPARSQPRSTPHGFPHLKFNITATVFSNKYTSFHRFKLHVINLNKTRINKLPKLIFFNLRSRYHGTFSSFIRLKRSEGKEYSELNLSNIIIITYPPLISPPEVVDVAGVRCFCSVLEFIV